MRCRIPLLAFILVATGIPGRRAAAKDQERHVYKVGLAETGFVPFTFPAAEKKDGVFMQLLKEIGAITGDRFEAVYGPNKRLQALFENGGIDLEPGINPAWRPDQAKISLYSDPFTVLVERLMFHDRSDRDGITALVAGGGGAGKKPAAAAPPQLGASRGYRYPKLEPLFTAGSLRRVDLDGEEALVRVLHHQRVDAIVIAEIPARYHISRIKDAKVANGPVTEETPIMFRVHHSSPDLVKRLNSGLAALQKRRRLERIIDSFLTN